MNVPPVPDADALAETLRRGAAAVLARSNAPNLMTYHLGGGNPTDRHAAALAATDAGRGGGCQPVADRRRAGGACRDPGQPGPRR